jgi:hypothetical protein
MQARGLYESSPLRSDASRNSQIGRLSLMSGDLKQLRGGNQTRVHSDRQGGWIGLKVAKSAQMRVGKRL